MFEKIGRWVQKQARFIVGGCVAVGLVLCAPDASAVVPTELTTLATEVGTYITWAIAAVAVILTSGFGIAGLVWGFKKLKAAMFKAA